MTFEYCLQNSAKNTKKVKSEFQSELIYVILKLAILCLAAATKSKKKLVASGINSLL